MKAYTDFPFEILGDSIGKDAPVREVNIIKFDGSEYVEILVEGVREKIRHTYLYTMPGRLGCVRMVPVGSLPK